MPRLPIEQITTEHLKGIITDDLRARVGFKLEWEVEPFAEACGIEKKTVYNVMGGQNLPNLHTTWRMAAVLGPAFLAKIAEVIGMGVYNLDDGPAVSGPVMNGEVSQLVAQLSVALADGHIDHREKAQIAKSMRNLIPLMQDWLRENDGKAVSKSSKRS